MMLYELGQIGQPFAKAPFLFRLSGVDRRPILPVRDAQRLRDRRGTVRPRLLLDGTLGGVDMLALLAAHRVGRAGAFWASTPTL
jgi:hypothetical protein